MQETIVLFAKRERDLDEARTKAVKLGGIGVLVMLILGPTLSFFVLAPLPLSANTKDLLWCLASVVLISLPIVSAVPLSKMAKGRVSGVRFTLQEGKLQVEGLRKGPLVWGVEELNLAWVEEDSEAPNTVYHLYLNPKGTSTTLRLSAWLPKAVGGTVAGLSKRAIKTKNLESLEVDPPAEALVRLARALALLSLY